MFVKEISEKLGLAGTVLPFSVSILGYESLVISGVKTVILSSPTELKVRVKDGVLKIGGEELSIVEIGSGDLYVKGGILLVEIEKK